MVKEVVTRDTNGGAHLFTFNERYCGYTINFRREQKKVVSSKDRVLSLEVRVLSVEIKVVSHNIKVVSAKM